MTDDPAMGATATACWCCGEPRGDEELVRLGCRPEVALCDGCVGWLDEQRPRRTNTVRRAIPILATSDVTRALRHYQALGFDADGWEGGGYGFLHRDSVELHLGEVEGLDPTRNRVSVYLFVADADQLYAQWAADCVDGQLIAPAGTDYALREGRHVDPDGSVIRFGSPAQEALGIPGRGELEGGPRG